MTSFIKNLIRPFPWARYSKKIALRIETPYCIGAFSQQDADERDLHLATAAAGTLSEGNCIALYWLVDKSDGVIIDARFSAFGNSSLIGAGEVASELVIGKNYDQAQRITADFIDKYVRDRNDIAAFPEEAYGDLNTVVDLIESVARTCEGLPLSANYTAPPISSHEIEIVDGGYPGFKTLPVKDKIAVIEEVIAKEIRPYIELDDGGIQVTNVIENEVIIVYAGACTSCHSATGATLSYIQQMLRAKIDVDLVVTPDLSTS